MDTPDPVKDATVARAINAALEAMAATPPDPLPGEAPIPPAVLLAMRIDLQTIGDN